MKPEAEKRGKKNFQMDGETPGREDVGGVDRAPKRTGDGRGGPRYRAKGPSRINEVGFT